ncbi:MAG: hypothetical protein CSB48_06810 [Proteobacteria bacterium]|nr:MAG: hypothetical protein CSB48_06810 [Pseudomonadota bacterium]
MELVNRAGESGRIPFRSSRFFCVGNKWYFSTREGFDSGPYADKCRAELGLKRFLHILQMLPQPHTERQALASSSS